MEGRNKERDVIFYQTTGEFVAKVNGKYRNITEITGKKIEVRMFGFTHEQLQVSGKYIYLEF